MVSKGTPTKYVAREPRPEYPVLHQRHVFDFLQTHGMKASVTPTHPTHVTAFASYRVPFYEVFEACVESLVTGEGMAAIRFKPQPWNILMRFGIPFRPVIEQNDCPIRIDQPDHFQVFAMRTIHDCRVVPVSAIATPLCIPAKHFPVVLEDPDLRFGCIMYRTYEVMRNADKK